MALQSFQVSLTPTAVAVSTTVTRKTRVNIQANRANAGVVAVGDSAGQFTTLEPKDSIDLVGAPLSTIWVKSTAATGDKVNVLAQE